MGPPWETQGDPSWEMTFPRAARCPLPRPGVPWVLLHCLPKTCALSIQFLLKWVGHPCTVLLLVTLKEFWKMPTAWMGSVSDGIMSTLLALAAWICGYRLLSLGWALVAELYPCPWSCPWTWGHPSPASLVGDLVWHPRPLQFFYQLQKVQEIFVHIITLIGSFRIPIWSHHFRAKWQGGNGNSGRFYFLGLPNHCEGWLQTWNQKTLAPWKKSSGRPREHIKKQRRHFTDKAPSGQSYGFSSRHVRMWELDDKEGWAPKNWRFWTVVLEKTLESPVDSKIKPVNPQGNQSWIFIARTDAEAKAPILWPPDLKSHLTGKAPDSGKDWGQD